MEPLTDVEAAALGCTHLHQPCTAHSIRTQFRTSPSARFSDSAGSVYPTMRRLERRGMVSSRLRRDGRRDVRYYIVTAAGRRALKAWLAPPFDVSGMVTHDSLRTRMIYLELLPASKRAAWLDEAESALTRLIAMLDEHRPDRVAPAPFAELANENARMETRARLDWIKVARRRLARAGLLS